MRVLHRLILTFILTTASAILTSLSNHGRHGSPAASSHSHQSKRNIASTSTLSGSENLRPDTLISSLHATRTRFTIGRHGAYVIVDEREHRTTDATRRTYYRHVLSDLRTQSRADLRPPDMIAPTIRLTAEYPRSSSPQATFRLHGEWSVITGNSLSYGDILDLFDTLQSRFIGREITARAFYRQNEVALLRVTYVTRSHQAAIPSKGLTIRENSYGSVNTGRHWTNHSFEATVFPVGQSGCVIRLILGVPRHGQLDLQEYDSLLRQIYSGTPFSRSGRADVYHKKFVEPMLEAKPRVCGWIIVNMGGVLLREDLTEILLVMRDRAASDSPRDFRAEISYRGTAYMARIIVKFNDRGGCRTPGLLHTDSTMSNTRDTMLTPSSSREISRQGLSPRHLVVQPRAGNLTRGATVDDGFPQGLSFGFGYHRLNAHMIWLGRVAPSQGRQYQLVWKEVLRSLFDDMKGQPVFKGFLKPGKIIVQYPQGIVTTRPAAVAEMTVMMPWSLTVTDVQALTMKLIALAEHFAEQELALQILNTRHHVIGSLRIEFESRQYVSTAATLTSRDGSIDLTSNGAAADSTKQSESHILPGPNHTTTVLAAPRPRVTWPNTVRLSDDCAVVFYPHDRPVPYDSLMTAHWLRALAELAVRYHAEPDEPRDAITIMFSIISPSSPHDEPQPAVTVFFHTTRPNHVPNRYIIGGINRMMAFVRTQRGGAQTMTATWELDDEHVADMVITIRQRPQRSDPNAF